MLRPSGWFADDDGRRSRGSPNSAGATVVVAPFAQSIASRERPVSSARVRKDGAQVIEIGADEIRARHGGGLRRRARCQDESATIASTSRSTRSVNFSPRPENTLMPLSSNGLCDAEITTPASKPAVRVR